MKKPIFEHHLQLTLIKNVITPSIEQLGQFLFRPLK
jgi:hypothetical protein